MTRGNQPIVSPPIIVPKDSGPPTNADGVPVPLPPSKKGGAVAVAAAGVASPRWEFVAAPRPAGTDLAATQAFFSVIQLVNASGKAYFYPYTAFPASLADDQATLQGDPPVVYDLSQYWVELYYLEAGDSIVLPSPSSIPAGVVTWIQLIASKTMKKTL